MPRPVWNEFTESKMDEYCDRNHTAQQVADLITRDAKLAGVKIGTINKGSITSKMQRINAERARTGNGKILHLSDMVNRLSLAGGTSIYKLHEARDKKLGKALAQNEKPEAPKSFIETFKEKSAALPGEHAPDGKECLWPGCDATQHRFKRKGLCVTLLVLSIVPESRSAFLKTNPDISAEFTIRVQALGAKGNPLALPVAGAKAKPQKMASPAM